MDSMVVAVTGLLSGVAAGLLTPWLRTLTTVKSRWQRTQVPLAAIGGAGAGLVAGGWAELLAFTALAVACALLIVVDLSAFRLPNIIVGPTFLIMVALLALQAGVDHTWDRFARALLAGLVCFGCFFLLALAAPDNLGLGDVKLAGLLGTFLGWQGWSAALLGMLLAFVFSAGVSIILLATRRANLKTAFPFGPWMILAAAVAVFL